MEVKTGRTLRELSAVLLLLAGLAALIWKTPRGMATADEALYLSIPYRLLQGDALLLHEWNLTQLSALPLLPLLRLALALRGTTQGIVLTFRRIYVLFHGLTTLYLYLRLRRLSLSGALCAALMYLVYAPMNIAALSYNTMGIGLLAIALVTIALSEGRTWEALLCGLCFAGAVLCNPYYFLLYPVYLAAAAFCALCKRACPPCLRGRFVLLLTAAGAAAALAALGRILMHGELPLLRETIPAILYGDATTDPSVGLLSILYRMFTSFGKNRLFLPTLGLSAAMLLCACFDKKRAAHAWAYLLIAALLSIAYGLWFRVYANIIINFYMFPLCIPGFFAWLIPEKRDDRLFSFVYVPGFLCWFCSAAASDLGFINIASVSTLNMLASAVFLCEAAAELWHTDARGRASAACLILAVAVQLGLLTEGRMRFVYPVRPVSACTAQIEHGALRGLLAEPEECARYEAAWAAAEPIRAVEGGFVAYLTDVPGQYLDDAKRCGAFSAWFPGVLAAENLPRLLHYWELFPDRVPEYLVIGTEDAPAAELLLRELEARGWREFGSGGGLVLLRTEENRRTGTA